MKATFATILCLLGYVGNALADGPNLLINPGFDSSLNPWVPLALPPSPSYVLWDGQADENNDPNSGLVTATLINQSAGDIDVVTQCIQVRPKTYVLIGVDTYIRQPSPASVSAELGISIRSECGIESSFLYFGRTQVQNAWTPIKVEYPLNFVGDMPVALTIALSVSHRSNDVVVVDFDNAYVIDDGVFRNSFESD
jgi:hypothetical protein